jgi:sodium/proline symporter
MDLSRAIFVVTLLATFFVSYLGRRHSPVGPSDAVAPQKLNKWLVGLSSGATANSGFVVTGAVGLGYSYGAQWLLLPIAWLAGDIVFWWFFPHRINEVGQRSGAATLTDLIMQGVRGPASRFLRIAIAVIVVVFLSGYTAAQWTAGQKFLSGAFSIGSLPALLAFASIIVCYTAIGGFRGSVYADSLQAIIRVIGTTTALVAIILHLPSGWQTTLHDVQKADPQFLDPLPRGSLLMAVGFTFGYAAAALGFGLGQPQMVSRYLAGKDPAETRAAWWIYMGFVQFTWLAMTLFGMILRLVIPNIGDPETGLSTFFHAKMGPILTGLIVADIFATIAATSNSLLVAMSQTIKFDLLGSQESRSAKSSPMWPITAILGATTMIASIVLHKSVVELALSSVSLLGAALAVPVLIRLLALPRSGNSLAATVVGGFAAAIVWRALGLNTYINEAAPGMAFAILTNTLWMRTELREVA